MWRKIIHTNGTGVIIIIQLIIGVVLLSEGIQKFLFPVLLGAGRFEKTDLLYPEFLGSFVGTLENPSGILILRGLFALVCIPLIVIMLVANTTKKAEVLGNKGFGEMMHEIRTDWSLLPGSIFLIIKGGGRWTLDERLVLLKEKWK
jgi:putative oxidoreductase